jgi:membrane protein DedA with SNARE-associated domain
MIRRFVGWLFLGGTAVFVIGISHQVELGVIVVGVLLVIVFIIWIIRKVSRKRQGW